MSKRDGAFPSSNNKPRSTLHFHWPLAFPNSYASGYQKTSTPHHTTQHTLQAGGGPDGGNTAEVELEEAERGGVEGKSEG